MNPSEPALEAWRLLLQAHRRLATRLDHELREAHGLPLDWYDVLYQLRIADGRLRMHELSNATLFSRADCTRLVDRMTGAGLVSREPAPEDRRGVYAVITGAGRRRLRAASGTHLDGIQRLFAEHLEPGEIASLRTGLQRVVDAACDGGESP
jgi:DNA-binding MarR family transcriptional regulator